VCPKRFRSLWNIRRKTCSCLEPRLALSPNGPSFHLSLVTQEYHRVRPKRFLSVGTFSSNCAPILHRHKHCLQTKRSEIPHDPCHLGVLSGASKMIFEPMVHSMQTMHLSCVKISTISKRTKTSFHLSLVT
jgi:hypothetical protein